MIIHNLFYIEFTILFTVGLQFMSVFLFVGVYYCWYRPMPNQTLESLFSLNFYQANFYSNKNTEIY